MAKAMFDESRVYTFEEIRRMLSESDYKPIIGSGVASADKRENAKATSDILKRTKDYDGGVRNDRRNAPPEDPSDMNRTTLGAHFQAEPSKEYKERVKAQVHGYPSKANEENAEENEALDYEGNKAFYDAQQKKEKGIADYQADERHAGLKSHNLPKENYKQNTAFNESKMKRLHFKNTIFINEANALSRVPDDYKKDGNVFKMRDKKGNECIIECKENFATKTVEAKVVNYVDVDKINEQKARMNQLANYRSSDFNPKSTSEYRLNEDKAYGDMVNKIRELQEKDEKRSKTRFA